MVGLSAASEVDYPGASLDRTGMVAWVKAHTDLPPDRVAMAGPIHVVAVTNAGRTGNIRKATVLGEVIDHDWAVRHRLVSWRTDIEVDCAASRVKSPNGRSYQERGRKGGAAAVFASADWTSPQAGDPIFGVVRAMCAADFQWPLRRAQTIRIAAKTPGAATARGPNVPIAPIDQPIRTASRVAEPPPPVSAMVMTEALTPSPAPPPSPLVAKPLAVATARSAPPRRAASRPTVARLAPKPTSARPGGAYAVQVLASSTASRAHAELSTLSRVFSAEVRGLKTAVFPATVNGKTYYRAMFTGLGAAPQAQSLCRAISRMGYDCMVRKI